MTRTTHDDLDRLYSLLARLAETPGQGQPLSDLPARTSLPERGVYFFREPGEHRAANRAVLRVVRVGTHAVSSGSKATLRDRLKTHLGTRTGGGNHRGSIFRRHVGAALLTRDGIPLATWGVGSSAPPAVRTSESARAGEAACEKRVSEHIGAMSVLWVHVPTNLVPIAREHLLKGTPSRCSLTSLLPSTARAKAGWVDSVHGMRFVIARSGT